jgi:uncharacterized membrane protein (DUF373 family)
VVKTVEQASEPIVSRQPGQFISNLLGLAEDVVYTGTAILLVGAALYALGSAAIVLLSALLVREGGVQPVLTVLDQILVVLIFIELFYTVRLSIREHVLAVEPFISVAMIATVRRILVLTAEERRLLDDAVLFQRLLIELALLAALVLVLAVAMVLLRRARAAAPKETA